MVVHSGMNRDGGQFRAPPAFLEVAATLEGRGYEAWAVGGALRDELLGVGSRPDWDLATDARYAVLRTAPRQPDYLLTFDASRFERGTIEHRWPVRTSVEIGGSAPPHRP